MSSPSSIRHTWRYWLFLFGAIVFEVVGTCVMKMGQYGSVFSSEVGYVLMLVMIGISYYLLSLSTQVLPVGVAFAFWEGLGLTFITLASVAFGEPLSLGRVLALCAVLGGAMLIHHGTEATDDEVACCENSACEDGPCEDGPCEDGPCANAACANAAGERVSC